MHAFDMQALQNWIHWVSSMQPKMRYYVWHIWAASINVLDTKFNPKGMSLTWKHASINY